MICVKVPATTANFGAGFDSLGAALDYYNCIWMEEWDGCWIEILDDTDVPTDETNLIYQTAKALYERCGRPFRGLHIRQENRIPTARGLGSSSACIAGGLLGANELLGRPCELAQLVDLAAAMEGHPDNSTPALLGGFVVSAYDEGHVYSLKKTIAPGITFAAFIPDFKLLTEKARAALPGAVAHRDAVYNVSRAALLAAAFCEERYDLLRVATGDRLHQPYRAALMPGMHEVFALCRQLGALGWWVSGAGPTLLCAVHAQDEAFFTAARAKLAAAEQSSPLAAYTLHRLAPDNAGAQAAA